MIRPSYLLLSLALFLLNACNKDKLNDVCVPLAEQAAKFSPPVPGFAFGDLYEVSQPCVGMLDVNPFNGDEFLLATGKKLESDGRYHGLYRYNLKTGRRIELPMEVYRTSSIRWSRRNWLIFAGQSGPQQWDAYKMKSDGDSLTRLTYSGNIHTPEWNWEGDKFICEMGLTSPAYSIIFDENGAPLDTVYAGGGVGSWRNPKGYRAGFAFTGSFRVTHPESNSTVFRLPVDDVSTAVSWGGEWIDEENAVWSYENGVFKTNFVTGQTVQLVSSCDAILYSVPIFSFQAGRVIFKRTVRKITSSTKGTQTSHFVTIDLFDGSLEPFSIEGCE
jgi:hypothetical protein